MFNYIECIMKQNKILIISLICMLTLIFPMVASAETQSEDQSLSVEPDYYQEKGQINLDGLKVSLDNEGGIVVAGKDSISKKKVLNELAYSENLTELVKDSVEEDNLPVAIGYTKVYLKEVIDEDGTSHMEPITNAERASQEISGAKETRGNLTLYTTAFATKIGITVKSTAQWGTAFQLSQANTPAPYYDYLSAATTSTYYLMNSSSFSANLAVMNIALPSKWYNRTKIGNASVTYSFMDCVTNVFSVKKAVVTINCGRVSGKTPPSTVKATSKYVHTWGSGAVDISVGTTGPSFNLSEIQKSWQIMSDVNTPSS